MRRLFLMLALSVPAGCAGTATYSASGSVQTPDLVAVSSDVQVIADYDEPIFYSGGYYWWNTDGGWYRSTYYTGGWGLAAPPTAVIRIGSEPTRYRHYRPRGYSARYRPVPSHKIQRPHRGNHRARR